MATSINGYYDVPEGVDVRGRYDADFAAAILTTEALRFMAELHREFRGRVRHAMGRRREAQRRYDAGAVPGFDPATRLVREGEWACAPVPPAIADRTVEITGPAERKMVINALNSGAKVFMADFEDALSPSWENLMRGQVNLRDAVDGTISFYDESRNKLYKLNDDKLATLFVRPGAGTCRRPTFSSTASPPSAASSTSGSTSSTTTPRSAPPRGRALGPSSISQRWSTPVKTQIVTMQMTRSTNSDWDSLEAKIWNDVFERSEKFAGIEMGSIRATVLIETLPAVFQMDEILYELRDHSVGLNCGRWDYIFSYVKTFRAHPDRLLPDRVHIGMAQHFMRSYSDLLIRTCHHRGVHAIGGMVCGADSGEGRRGGKRNSTQSRPAGQAARGPRRPRRHVGSPPGADPGHRCCVRRPHARRRPHQIRTADRNDASTVSEHDLLRPPHGPRTLGGLRLNTRIGIQYLAVWLAGTGSVPLYNLMEDAATAEISRVQNWQWIRYGVDVDADGVAVTVTRELFARVLEEEIAGIERACTAAELDDFLTLDAYDRIVVLHPASASTSASASALASRL
uniref:Malate synthase n=1 Tax=Ananas comosus var. bracteatus TaxID=296719 RepID=A0A6V7Q270_ANACO|nr:unnamed protein product [Ananas comosus var. bracteatus]